MFNRTRIFWALVILVAGLAGPNVSAQLSTNVQLVELLKEHRAKLETCYLTCNDEEYKTLIGKVCTSRVTEEDNQPIPPASITRVAPSQIMVSGLKMWLTGGCEQSLFSWQAQAAGCNHRLGCELVKIELAHRLGWNALLES